LTGENHHYSNEVKQTFRKSSLIWKTLGAMVVGTILLSLYGLDDISTGLGYLSNVVNEDTSANMFDEYNRYIMKDYDIKKPMASFLAGVAGIWGKPCWSFYVNRGQGMAGFGIKNKDGGILRYETAEKAYANTPFNGFRTLIKGKRVSSWGEYFDTALPNYEPFKPRDESLSEVSGLTRDMFIGMNEFEIKESHSSMGLDTSVLYFTLPNEDFPAMVGYSNVVIKKTMLLLSL
jgi:hypothetical protein